MRTLLLIAAVLALVALAPAPATAQDTTDVAQDPAPMTAADVAAVVTGSADHAALASALDSAGLVVTLQGAGPYTVFAPTDAAFTALGEHGTMLMDPEHAEMLSGVLTYHVVAERLDAARLADRVREAGGQLTLTTLHGAPLTVSLGENDAVVLTDATGNMATVTTADLGAANGVVHVIDVVLMPSAAADDGMDGMDHDMPEEDGSN